MLRTESYKKGLVFSTVFNIVAKGVGFINTLVIAYYFGANASTDIYFMVLSVALIFTGIINGIDLLVLIPEAMRLRERESEEASRRFLNFFFFLYAFIGVVIAAIIVLSPVLFYSLFSKFDNALLQQNDKILYIGSAIILFQVLNNLLGAILSSYKFFTASILTTLINSLFAIILTVSFHEQLGVVGTISGIALGYLLNFILLVSALVHFQKWNFFRVGWMKNKQVWTNIGLMQLNNLPLWLRTSIGLYMLSGFDKGLITALNLGLQITSIPEIFIINQMLAVSGIKFNELHAQRNHDRANETYLLLARVGLAFTTIAGCCCLLLSDKIIAVIFSGTALGADSLKNVAMVFAFMMFCLPAKFLATLSTNIFTAFQKIKATVLVSFITHCFVTVAFVFLIKYFGLVGYLVGQNLHFYLFFVLFILVFKRTLPFIKYKKVIGYFFKDLLLNGVVCVLAYLLYQPLFRVVQNNILQVLCGLFIYFFLIILINESLNINSILKIKKYKDYVFQRFFS